MNENAYGNKMIGAMISILIMSVLSSCSSLRFGPKDTSPKAIVIDAKTGQPIEGAIALAVWWGASGGGGWFEGSSRSSRRIEEVVSDKEGKIYIDGFWDTEWFDIEPHLTIYKPGYICWDQEHLFVPYPEPNQRTDFNKENRIVRMELWREGLSYSRHFTFINGCTGYFSMPETPNQLFKTAFLNHESEASAAENEKARLKYYRDLREKKLKEQK